eukprot:INCI14144.1.p1 GENE.INCI14144.1~~INCI14144.1.p1  ORF type:complete len:369 (+),score=73.93 INCI14144.1:136-1242(+)
MAEVEDISREEADSLSPADPTQLSGKQMKALLASKGVTMSGPVEKAELRALVKKHATRTDVENFLVQSARETKQNASASSRTTNASKSPNARQRRADGLSPKLRTFARQMIANAKGMRKNPRMYRRGPLANYSDEQIRAYADMCERIAKDPAQLKIAHAQAMAQQRGGASGASGGIAAQLGAMTDAQLDHWVSEVQNNPAAIRAQMIMAGGQYGMDAAKVDQILGAAKQMDPKTLKGLLKLGQKFQGVATRLMTAYTWLDRTSGGFGKVIVGVLGLICLYFFFMYLAGPLWYAFTYIPKLLLSWIGLYTWPNPVIAEAGAHDAWVGGTTDSGANVPRGASRAELFNDVSDEFGDDGGVDDEFSEFDAL